MRTEYRTFVLALAAVLLTSGVLSAQSVPVGGEFQVNTYTTDYQYQPDIAVDADGDFVVVWTDGGYFGADGQDGSSYGVFGQRYDKTGAAVGGEFQVNTFTAGTQREARAAAAAGGEFVVVWESRNQDGSVWGVFGQRYDSAGAAAGGEFQVNTYTPSGQRAPAVAAADDGDFVVVWMSATQDGLTYGIFGQRYDSAGASVGGEFLVNTYTSAAERFPDVAMNADGTFVVVWQGGSGSYPNPNDGSDSGIFGQRYDSSGAAVGGEFMVNTYTTGRQGDVRVAINSAGGFVVVWENGTEFSSDLDVFGQAYDSAGSPVGGEFQVNTNTAYRQYQPTVGMDGAGSFVVAWTDNKPYGAGQDGSYAGVFAQAFDSAGSPVGGEFQVNTNTANYQYQPALGMDDAGNFVVAWTDNGYFSPGQDGSYAGVFAQRYGTPDSDGDGIPDDEDECPDSDLSETVVIDGCDSGVTNYLFDNGCTISDLVGTCADDASNHGQFVSCVAHLTNELKRDGIISGREKGKIQSCAARADIP